VTAPLLSVLVPVYNERATLETLLQRVLAVPVDKEVLVVDDGSRDGTARAACEAGVPVLRHAVNLGVGGALQTGFRWAWEHGYDIAVQLDADGQHDPAYLPALLAPVREGRCDVAIGSRFVAATGYRAPWSRRLGMLMFSGVVRLALGRPISDTTSGFRAYNRAVMRVCQYDFPKDFPDAPLLISLARRGFRIDEVPVVMRERKAGQSFYTLGKQLYYPYKNLLASLMALIRRPS
jgi:glycosyltransferase involved in cell wall biosynthesis